jgi:crotonobetainyl-CoA:carnitine CoA-transferase CaiB-like acyl-CoA transferase
VKTESGKAILLRLIEEADVLLTSFRAPALTRLGLDPDSARRINPALVYARGNAFGTEGPDADAPGYDATAFWSRGGFAYTLTAPGADYPTQMRPALGDRATSMALAMGVCAALTKRGRTGQGSTVDVSLMGTASWILAGDVLAGLHGIEAGQEAGRSRNPNPLTNVFRTRDGRWIQLNGLQPDRYWADLCRVLEREDLIDDPRYREFGVRSANADSCLAELDAAFASRDYADWKERMQKFAGPWAPVQSALELVDDAQTRANGFVVQLEGEERSVYAIAGPVVADGGDGRLRRSPCVGENTEEVLLELGMTWEEIIELKDAGAIT